MNILQTLTRSVTRRTLIAKKNSPHIFFVGGVVGVVASTALACRATLKLPEKLDEIQKNLAETDYMTSLAGDVRDFEEIDKAKVAVYIKGGLEITRLYAPAVIVGTASIAALTGSHVQMSRRNAALMAAYAAVQEAYEQYRERVRSSLGEERELELYRGVETEVVKIDGVKKEIKTVDPYKRSPYARCFDETSTEFQKDPELNRYFIECQQRYANQLLRHRGHVFLNEIYDALGFERTPAGAVVGWVIDDGTGPGDNYIDFGIFEAGNSRFVNSLERSVWLDFNVDGVIYDKI